MIGGIDAERPIPTDIVYRPWGFLIFSKKYATKFFLRTLYDRKE